MLQLSGDKKQSHAWLQTGDNEIHGTYTTLVFLYVWDVLAHVLLAGFTTDSKSIEAALELNLNEADLMEKMQNWLYLWMFSCRPQCKTHTKGIRWPIQTTQA